MNAPQPTGFYPIPAFRPGQKAILRDAERCGSTEHECEVVTFKRYGRFPAEVETCRGLQWVNPYRLSHIDEE